MFEFEGKAGKEKATMEQREVARKKEGERGGWKGEKREGWRQAMTMIMMIMITIIDNDIDKDI